MSDEAVLHISNWYSWCGACRQQTLPDAITHEKVSGYGPPRAGCGAKFVSVTSDYGNDEACRRIRPDLPLAAAVLPEPPTLHDPRDFTCDKRCHGEPFSQGVRCPICNPGAVLPEPEETQDA